MMTDIPTEFLKISQPDTSKTTIELLNDVHAAHRYMTGAAQCIRIIIENDKIFKNSWCPPELASASEALRLFGVRASNCSYALHARLVDEQGGGD